MKSLIFSFVLATLAVASFAQGSQVQPLPIGSKVPMPEADLKTTNGLPITLNKAMGENGLLVMFSCNTCPYVVKSQNRTREAISMAQALGVGIVILNSNEAQRGEADSYDAMKKYANAQGYNKVPYAVDEGSRLANAFGATRTPEVFLFDKKGLLVYKGAMEDNPSDPAHSKEYYLAAAMKHLQDGTEISPAETKSIGCSIKRIN
jgi:peroxiredoxin